MKQTIAVLGLVALVGCAGLSDEPEYGLDLVTAENLSPSQSSYFDVVYGTPAAYGAKKIYMEPLNLESVEIIDPSDSSSFRRRNAEWELTAEDSSRMALAWAEITRESLEKDGYEVVDQAGPGVLSLSPAMVKIRPTAPKDDTRSRDVTEEIYTEGSGDLWITMRGELDGEVVLWIEDKRQAGQLWENNNRVSNWANYRQTIRSWLGSLKAQLESEPQ